MDVALKKNIVYLLGISWKKVVFVLLYVCWWTRL